MITSDDLAQIPLFANVEEARSYLGVGPSQNALPEEIAATLVERGAGGSSRLLPKILTTVK